MRPRQFAHLDGHDAYEVLGVDIDASRVEIEAARRALVKVLHPDRPGGDAARMSLVNAAADILLDATQRAEYDAYLEDEPPPPVTPTRVTPAQRRPVRPESAAEPGDAGDYDAGGYESADYDPAGYKPAPSRRDRGTGLFGRPRRRPETLDTEGVYQPPPPPRRAPPAAGQDPSSRPAPAGRQGSPRQGSPRQGSPSRQGSASRPASPRPAPPARRAAPSRSAPSRVTPPDAAESTWVGTAEVPPRPLLRWQPPPPGRLARWHAKRRYGRELARGQRVSPSGGPLVVVGLLATLIAICAIGGALIGISTGTGSAGTPAPRPATTHPTTTHPTTTHPGTHPAPKPSGKATTGRPKPTSKPTGTHRS